MDKRSNSNRIVHVLFIIIEMVMVMIISICSFLAEDIEKILIDEILYLDQQLVKMGDDLFLYTKGGSTCVVAVVTPSDIIVANVGDSPAIVFSSNGLLLCQVREL